MCYGTELTSTAILTWTADSGVDRHYIDPGKPVLQEVSFCAEPGTVTALVGSSGSGKSSAAAW